MKDWENELLQCDIKMSMRFCKYIKLIKIFLAILILYAYFADSSWFGDIIVVAVIFSLLLPLGFFDVFIQRLTEYNAISIEKRVVLNAKETNQTFHELCSKNTPPSCKSSSKE